MVTFGGGVEEIEEHEVVGGRHTGAFAKKGSKKTKPENRDENLFEKIKLSASGLTEFWKKKSWSERKIWKENCRGRLAVQLRKEG